MLQSDSQQTTRFIVGHIRGPVLAWTDGSRSVAVSADECDYVIIARLPLTKQFKRGRKLTIEVASNRSPAREAPFEAVSIR
jgi:hypothetical protein